MVTISQKFTVTPVTGASANVQAHQLGFASALALLSRFKQLMAAEGHTVDSRLMLSYSSYATEQLALGHTSTTEPLRLCAMRVFALLHA
jgi:hypothetical protein